MNGTQRPVLGQLASIGTLFNEKTETFLPLSLLKQEAHSDVIFRSASSAGNQTQVKLTYFNTYKAKFDLLGIEPELSASILAGFLNPGGAGQYLNEFGEDSNSLHAAVCRKYITHEDKLNFTSSNLRDCLDSTVIQSEEATHMVLGIQWGAQSVITARCPVPGKNSESAFKDQFQKDIEAFRAAVEGSQVSSIGSSKNKIVSNLRLEVTAYGDNLNDGISMNNLREGLDYLDLVPLEIKSINNGLGHAIAYTLLPLSTLPLILPTIQVVRTSPSGIASRDCLNNFVQLFDTFRNTQQKLQDYQVLVRRQERYLPPDYVKAVQANIEGLRIAEEKLKTNFARCLQHVRTGAASPETLQQLLVDFSTGDHSPSRFLAIRGIYREKVHFVEHMVANGAVYIGYNGLSVEGEMIRKGAADSYIFRFSTAAMVDKVSWKANWQLLEQLIKERKKGTFIAIVDCDASAAVLEKAQILHFQNNTQVTSDLVEQRNFFADKCLARYEKHRLDTTGIKQKPLRRRFVKIPCPGVHCNPTTLCDWLCSTCLEPFEFGYSDEYLYCDCGRTSYRYFDFKCSHDNHGSGYERYDAGQLLKRLQKLEAANYLNILILGETGVGKSTFINAFVNYLTFATLDEAMKEEKLTWVIPCSFDAMTMDRTKPDSKIKRTKIAVGSRSDEVDGSKGASATQQTTVYPVTIGTTTVRLIDTPGIGDTRGLEFDKKNMADIITTLGSYDDLHGVLILLKSNMARLTPTFSFCIKELLRNLHRDAARNMAFGFTNTRISNYTPGDTLGPLEALLEEHPDVGLSTSTNAMYCFDSESFRYLAAHKNNFVMPNEEDFRRSWTHSKEEVDRLIEHFKTRKPHMIKSTTSLHGTRELISMLTIPMAQLSQTIRANIELCKDNMDELKNTRATGEELRKKLRVNQIYLAYEELGHHRTVCRDKACFEVRKNANGDTFNIYSKPCHDHCYLSEIIPDTFNQPGLIRCTAFGGSQDCRQCGHPWNSHMHVIKEAIERTIVVNDVGVEKQLADHAEVVQAKQQAIEDLNIRIEEYRDEHKQIQKAAAQFSNFLRKEAIALYNDKTQDYIEFLINEEEAKVHAGKDNKQLLNLREDLRKYLEEVNLLKVKVGVDENYPAMTVNDIDRLVKHLYSLKHFGKNLEALKKKNVKIYEAQNREINHRVRSKQVWGWNTIANISGSVLQTVTSHSPYPSYSKTPSQRTGRSHIPSRKPVPYHNGPPPYQEYTSTSPFPQPGPHDVYNYSSQDSYTDPHASAPTSWFSYEDPYPSYSRQPSTSNKKIFGVSLPKWGKS